MEDFGTKLVGLLKSKTFWVAVAIPVLTAVTPLVRDWISANPGVSATIVSALFGVLMRWVTVESLAVKGS